MSYHSLTNHDHAAWMHSKVHSSWGMDAFLCTSGTHSGTCRTAVVVTGAKSFFSSYCGSMPCSTAQHAWCGTVQQHDAEPHILSCRQSLTLICLACHQMSPEGQTDHCPAGPEKWRKSSVSSHTTPQHTTPKTQLTWHMAPLATTPKQWTCHSGTTPLSCTALASYLTEVYKPQAFRGSACTLELYKTHPHSCAARSEIPGFPYVISAIIPQRAPAGW